MWKWFSCNVQNFFSVMYQQKYLAIFFIRLVAECNWQRRDYCGGSRWWGNAILRCWEQPLFWTILEHHESKIVFFKKKIVNFFCKYFCKKKFVIFFQKKFRNFLLQIFVTIFFVVLNNLDNELYQSPARHCTHMRCCRYKVASTQCILFLIFPRFEGKPHSQVQTKREEKTKVCRSFSIFLIFCVFLSLERNVLLGRLQKNKRD